MNVLTLCEYESLKVGDVFDSNERAITDKQFALLECFCERCPLDVFKYNSPRTLKAQNFVGVIHLDNLIIEILPKIEGLEENEEIGQLRKNLLKMLMVSQKIDVHPGEISGMHQQDSFWDILMDMFCQRLRQAIAEGLVRRYEHQEDILPVLRGKLNITQQLRRNPAQAHLLACQFDEFTSDTPLNQALKASLRVISKVAKSHELQQNANNMIAVFDEVSDVVPDSLRWEQIVLDRLTKRYEPLLKIARMLIENTPPDITTGDMTGFAVLFDMNKLFESYIGAICQDNFDSAEMTIHLQGVRGKRYSLLMEPEKKQRVFELLPDIIFQYRGKEKYPCILDTKWKILDENERQNGVSQSDIYQMYAYSTRYEADKVILLYPHHSGLSDKSGVIKTHQLIIKDDIPSEQIIQVATIDLRNLDTVKYQLRQIINLKQ